MSRSFSSLFERWWDDVCSRVNSSLLFMDNAAAETLHWHGGLPRVLKSGAVAVQNLSVFEKVDPAHRKAIFLVASPITPEVLKSVMVIVRNSNFYTCTIITSLPAWCHDVDISDANQKFHFLEKQLLSWMGSRAHSAEVLYIPVFGVCLLPEILCVPALSEFFRPLSTGFGLMGNFEGDQKTMPDHVRTGIKVLASCLNALLEGLKMKGDVFSLGHLSHEVGVELENLAHMSKKKAAASKASILLLDRTLDLAGPLSQTVDTPFGKMLRVLPHLCGHVCDVSVCMDDISYCKNDTVFGLPLLAPGCIAHRNNSAEDEVLKILLRSKIKEAVIEINRKVVQLGAAEGLTFDSAGSGALKLLQKSILLYREKTQLLSKYCGLLQQALSIVQTLDHPKSSYLDNLLAAEKLLVQNYSLSKQKVAEDITRLITSRKERSYKMSDILALISFLFALSDDDVFDPESEASVQAAVIETLFQEDEDAQYVVQKLAGDDAGDQDILTAVKTFFSILKKLNSLHKDLKTYRLFECGDPALPATYKPMLKQIMDSIFNSSEIPDIEFHSAGLKDYIKTGFSLFMNVAKPLPRDNPVIIVFVIGGITAAEIKMMHDMTCHHKANKILFGSTSLLTPEDVMEDLFHMVQNLTAVDDDSDETVEDF